MLRLMSMLDSNEMRHMQLNGYKIAALFACLCGFNLFAEPRPNVLFIMADDLNTDLGFMGDTTARTPHLDQLAKEATVFNKAYCQAPICGPSRNSLLTGIYPHNSGLYSLDPRYDEVPEYADLVSLPLLFRNNGYSTKNAGKI